MAKYIGEHAPEIVNSNQNTVNSVSESKPKKILKKVGEVFKKPVTWVAVIGISAILAVGLSVGLPMRSKLNEANNNLKKTEEVLDSTTKDNQDKADIIAGLTDEKDQAQQEKDQLTAEKNQLESEKEQLEAEKEAVSKAEADKIAETKELQEKLLLKRTIKADETIQELTLNGEQYIKVIKNVNDSEVVSRIIKINDKYVATQTFKPLATVIDSEEVAQRIADYRCDGSNKNTVIYVSVDSTSLEAENEYSRYSKVSSIHLNGNDELIGDIDIAELYSRFENMTSKQIDSALAKVSLGWSADYTGEVAIVMDNNTIQSASLESGAELVK